LNIFEKAQLGRGPKGKMVSPQQGLEFYGGDEEDRTPDLRIANAALSQLSYIPMVKSVF
jgi:hypothetical protein